MNFILIVKRFCPTHLNCYVFILMTSYILLLWLRKIALMQTLQSKGTLPLPSAPAPAPRERRHTTSNQMLRRRHIPVASGTSVCTWLPASFMYFMRHEISTHNKLLKLSYVCALFSFTEINHSKWGTVAEWEPEKNGNTSRMSVL